MPKADPDDSSAGVDEQAHLLVAAISSWLGHQSAAAADSSTTGATAPPPESGSEQARDETGEPGAAAGPAPGPNAGHAPDCTWCPLCRGAELLRQVPPSTWDSVADLLGAAASAVRRHGTSQHPHPEPNAAHQEGRA